MLELLDAAEAVLGPPAWAMYLAFDHSDPRFARRDARLAFAHAIDRKALAAVLPRTIGVAGGGIVPPALQGHTPDIVPRFDPELARDLLAESGFTGGLTLAAPRGSLLDGMCQTVVETWRSILDIDASWNAVEFEQWLSAPSVWSLGDVAGQLWFPGYPDAEYYLRLLLHSDSTDNVGRYADADFDSLIERARAERDGSRRLELFHAADRMAIAEHAAVIPLGYASNAVVTKPWLTGWWEYGKSWSGFADLVLDEEARRTSLP
jgi:ABC-type transport system substrate-binding protein